MRERTDKRKAEISELLEGGGGGGGGGRSERLKRLSSVQLSVLFTCMMILQIVPRYS